jgi:hypothetical protein
MRIRIRKALEPGNPRRRSIFSILSERRRRKMEKKALKPGETQNRLPFVTEGDS